MKYRPKIVTDFYFAASLINLSFRCFCVCCIDVLSERSILYQFDLKE